MANRNKTKRQDSILTPKRWWGYSVVLFIVGSLFPPLAVAARFGIGKDFFTNLLLTLCGYFPGHFHNFYIQNIRNNKNARRTPKWAVKYGLIDDTALKRRAKRQEWATRFNDRNPQSTYEGQPVEEGQIPDRVPPESSTATRQPGLWNNSDESEFYGQPGASGSVTSTSESHRGRWHYPANFDETEPPSPSTPKKSKSKKKDRHARTEDAYAAPPKKKKSKGSMKNGGTQLNNVREDTGGDDGFGYGTSDTPAPGAGRQDTGDDGLNHQF
ncbi:hypothetical protein FRB94_009985 [Tulasnella sp. JGI-2019a]|nr:hypothetical protein FRB93_011074 [Tulasnella sp. JGI-2019a]KAG9010709.1 hypothetical protein FRB94_009985 [Tulasnella sp. JGI-2019a]KAG9028613.1 hypothetical protein FRB95_006291 [Tulasnella sp. JGI-2019a]